MLVLVCVVHAWIYSCYSTFPLKACRGLQRQILWQGKTPRCVSQTPRSVAKSITYLQIFPRKLHCLAKHFSQLIRGLAVQIPFRKEKNTTNLVTLALLCCIAGHFELATKKSKILFCISVINTFHLSTCLDPRILEKGFLLKIVADSKWDVYLFGELVANKTDGTVFPNSNLASLTRIRVCCMHGHWVIL